jgi:SynChlorMet cassette radical SAM/SPASM protein ScmE
VTIHKHNVHHLDEIAKFFLDDLELPSISLCDVFGIGYGRDASGQTRLDTDLLSYAMERMLWLSEEKYPNRIFSPSHGPLGRTDGWCELEFARERSALSSTPDHLRSCGAAKMAIAVRADGVYVPCGQLSHIELGRINQDSLQDIWWNHPELERLRARYEISLGNFDFCKGCDYISGCPGGCPGTAYELAGSDEHPSPDVCLRRFLHDGGRLPEKRMASLRSTYTTPVSDQLSGNEVANG